jgi:prepilin-type N-terminal cleavage/methylation domain-containing protein
VKARGFSMLEIILVIALTGTLALFVVGLFLTSTVTGNVSLERARAGYLAQSELTRCKLLGYAALEHRLTAPAPPQSVSEGGQLYVRDVSVQRMNDVPGTPEYALLKITVHLEWKERRQLEMRETRVAAEEATGRLSLSGVVSREAQF